MAASCGLCELEFGEGTPRAFPCGHVACIRCVEERAREGPGAVCPHCGKICKLEIHQLLTLDVDSFAKRVWCKECDAAASDGCLLADHALAALPALQRRAAEELAGVGAAAADEVQRLADLILLEKERLLEPAPPAGLLETRAKVEKTKANLAMLRELLPKDDQPSQPLQAALAALRDIGARQAKVGVGAADQADGRLERELDGALQLREAELAVREEELRKKEAELGALAEALQQSQQEALLAKQIVTLEGLDNNGGGGPDVVVAAAANNGDAEADGVDSAASDGAPGFPKIRIRASTRAPRIAGGRGTAHRDTRSRSRGARKAREEQPQSAIVIDDDGFGDGELL